MDWSTPAELATAGGTLVLAIATFVSTRTANRSTRLAEEALLAGIRPLLLAARPQDPAEKVIWYDQHVAHVPGGRAVVEEADGVIYLAMTVRNVGTGLALMHAWSPVFGGFEGLRREPVAPEAFHRLTADLYVAPNDSGYWVGAVREATDPDHDEFLEIIKDPERFAIDILYGDQEGGQRTITRFSLTPAHDTWLCTSARHWYLDRPDPR